MQFGSPFNIKCKPKLKLGRGNLRDLLFQDVFSKPDISETAREYQNRARDCAAGRVAGVSFDDCATQKSPSAT